MQVITGLCIFAFLIRFAIYLSVSLIAGSTVAAYQLVLVELTFKVMVIYYMANLIRKAKIHKPVITCIRSSGEVIMSGKEFYTRRQDIAKIVSIQEIFITKREKHESLE
jgi:hypothetical protein